MTYAEFIAEDLKGSYKITIDQPRNPDGSNPYILKLGPFVYVDVQVEILNIYSRSVELFLSFDGLTVKKLFFTPSHEGPDIIHAKIFNKIDKIVNKALLEDGREEWIREEYRKKKERLNNSLKDIAGKIKEIDDKNKENHLLD
jgi:hypothetical protein